MNFQTVNPYFVLNACRCKVEFRYADRFLRQNLLYDSCHEQRHANIVIVYFMGQCWGQCPPT